MTVAIYGHRGYPARFPENSLQGFEYACEHGIDGIETDVQMSADGHLVIMHDERGRSHHRWYRLDRRFDANPVERDAVGQWRTHSIAAGSTHGFESL